MIGYVAELARWALALVFAAAVIGKLVWPDGLAGLGTTLRVGLHVPARLARPAAVALVSAEGVVAVLIAVPGLTTAGLLGAGLLSTGLTAGAVVLARRTEALPCRCFGAGSATVTWSTVLRNAGLTALAAAALALAGPADGRGAGTTVSLAALMTAAAALLTGRRMALRAPRRGHDAHHDTHGHGHDGATVTPPPSGPEAGTLAPAVPGTTGGVQLVAFASATCQGCRTGLPRLVAYARLLGGRDRVAVAIVGDAVAGADIEAAVAGVARVVGGERAEALATAYGVTMFPTYVLVGADGLVEAAAVSVDELPRPVR
ncbi:MauE/DoxX family redox-associated membrane protein [Jiangella mangrovi]|uniref:Methylamine utilisation protein MauE domain-containing protein n=1 Tax=Jiangella mangrovi TaxID=1524084 RepID=A0A7W9LNS1_9ACTN|nr:MauE/DoxX family redox-associated membrane protein [Jiangella mangrovi]MBB5790571.1 hypothetical protein [Jiangella mangrovi]